MTRIVIGITILYIVFIIAVFTGLHVGLTYWLTGQYFNFSLSAKETELNPLTGEYDDKDGLLQFFMSYLIPGVVAVVAGMATNGYYESAKYKFS